MIVWQWTQGAITVFTRDRQQAQLARNHGHDVRVVPHKPRVFL